MKRIVFTILAAACSLGALVFIPGTAAASCSVEGYLGQICFTAADFCPRDYVKAEGQLLPITANQALYALLGTAYGGNGTSNFGVPDLRGRSAVGTGTPGGLLPVSRGDKRGAVTRTMTLNQMPSHDHEVDLSKVTVAGTVNANSSDGSQSSPEGAYPGVGSVGSSPPYRNSGAQVDMAGGSVIGTLAGEPITTETTGAALPISVQGPRLGLTACIRTMGLFPPRN